MARRMAEPNVMERVKLRRPAAGGADRPRFRARRDRPTGLQRSGAVTQPSRITGVRGPECHTAQAAGLGHDPACLGIGCDWLLPEDNAGADFTGEDQALISVLNEHDARLKIREAVRPRANITARHAQGCGLDGLFR